MKNLRFLSVTAILVIVLVAAIGIGAASAQTVCSPATAISVPFAKDGPGTFCYQAVSMCNNINSWNMTSLQINGTSYTNMWVSGSSIPALNGVFTITYNGGQFGHFEIDGPCSGGNPTPTLTRTITQIPITATGTGRSQTPVNQPTRTWTPNGSFTTTRTPTRTFTPTITRTSTPWPGSLKVQYRPGDANASTAAIHPMIRIINAGSSPVSLDDITFRYWYTWEGTPPGNQTQGQAFTCISATVPGGCASLLNDLASPSLPSSPPADALVQNYFAFGTGQIGAGQSIDIEYSVTKFDSSLYNQTDDYSFNSSFTTYTDWPKISLWYAPIGLVWGVEPQGMTATPTPITITNTPTRTFTPSATPTFSVPTATWTATVVGAPTPVVGPNGACSPVSGDIAADPGGQTVEFFVHGTFCWRSTNLGSAINSFSTLQLLINGANFTNIWAPTSSLPAKINGFWYIYFQSSALKGDFLISP
jgi:hypothetical protein